jgi:pyruvate kinase
MMPQSGHDRDGCCARCRGSADRRRCRGEVGDLIVLTIGEPIGKSGGTNTMKIVKVGEHRSNH